MKMLNEPNSYSEKSVSDKFTMTRYERNGALLGLCFGLSLPASSRLLCESSTGSTACGFGSATVEIIFTSIVTFVMVGLGMCMGTLIGNEHPALRRFHLWSFAVIVLLELMLPSVLYQLHPQWKTQVWDEKWDDWFFLAMIVIYHFTYRFIKKRFERKQSKL